jgi:hypothetical protein
MQSTRVQVSLKADPADDLGPCHSADMVKTQHDTVSLAWWRHSIEVKKDGNGTRRQGQHGRHGRHGRQSAGPM